MNAPKFTPGPWLLYGDTMRDVLVERGNADEVGDEAYQVVATTRVHGGHHFHCVSGEEQFANARLIAAAPEMYAALNFVRKYAEMREAKGDTLPSQLTNAVLAALVKVAEVTP